MSGEADNLVSTLETAIAKLRDGDAVAADAICRHLLEEAPEDPMLHQLAAAIAFERRDFVTAARWTASSLEGRPNHVPTLVLAGRVARSAGDHASALSFFRRAAAIAPTHAEPAFMLCVTLLELGNAQANELLPQLLDRFPDHAEGWQSLSEVLHNAGKNEAALIALARTKQTEPSAALHLLRGKILQSLGRLYEAAGAFRAATTLAPGRVDPAMKLALCLKQAGNGNAAAEILLEIVVLDPSLAQAWFTLGVIEQDRNNLPAAIAMYSRAVAAQPKLAEAAVNLGICLQESGDLPAAKAAYRVALQLRSDSFGRIAQALAAAPTGEVWLDSSALRRSLRC